MSKIDNAVQGDFDTYIFKCYCGEDSYIEVMQDPDDRDLYFSITMRPTRLKDRLNLAYKALRGLEFTSSNSVILLETDADKLIDALRLAQQDTRSTQKPTKRDLKNATTEATQERKEALDEL